MIESYYIGTLKKLIGNTYDKKATHRFQKLVCTFVNLPFLIPQFQELFEPLTRSTSAGLPRWAVQRNRRSEAAVVKSRSLNFLPL